MSVRTTGSVLVVFVCCVKMTFTSQKICALKGSTVELSCSYSYSRGYTVRANGWYSKNKNSHWTKIQDTDSGLVSHHGNKKNDCTLRITDVREEHSTSYCFGYTLTTYLEKECSPVTLAVTELQVTVSRSYPYKLTCSTTCTLPGNPTYIWYRNGQHIDESTSPQYKYSVYSNYENSYSCAVKGHEDLHSPVVCIQGQRCSRVIYTKRRICVLKGSSVDISCTYDGYNDVRSSLWFSTKQSSRWRDTFTPKDLTTEPGFVGRVEYPYQESRRYSNSFTLRINNVREEDSAEYRFTFNTYHFKWGNSLPGTTLTVTDVVLEMDHASVSEGDRVTLTCRTKCTLNPIPEYIWYKNRQTIENSNNYSTTLKFSVTSEDSGRYSCAVKGHEDIRSTEENLTVRYAPKKTSVSVSPSGEIVEGSSVTLTCSSDANPPADKYTWYKKNVASPKASGQSYTITNITSEASGEYYCEAENKYGCLHSLLMLLDILYGPRMPLLSVSPSGEIVEGSSVTLTCSSDASPPVYKYTWYKKNVASPKASGQSYNITNIRSEDSGEYYCEAENQRASMNSTTLLIALAGRQTSVMTRVVVITGVVLVLILCLFGFAWFWINASKITSDKRNTRNTAENGQGESSPVYDNISCTLRDSTAGQAADKDNQDAILYTNIFLSCPGNQDVPLYSTVQLPQRQKKTMDVQYTTLKFNSPSDSSRPAAQTTEEDASMIYSTVNKHRGPVTRRKEMRP